MSEVVGIIASSIAIGKLVCDLQQKCRAFRDAPTEIKSLLDESRLVNDQLRLISQQQIQIGSYILPNAEWASCRKFCQETADELNELLSKLSRSLDKDRWRGSLRTLIREEEINRRKRKLERAKSSLMLAQQSLSLAFQVRNVQQFSELIDIHRILKDNVVQRDVKNISLLTGKMVDSVDEVVKKCERFEPTSSLSTEKPQERGRLAIANYKFITPTQLFGWACQAQIWRYSNNWTISFRTWNYRSPNSPTFQHAMNGDLAGLKKLIVARQGSIYDVMPSGSTLLHIAMRRMDLSMAKFLIAEGGGVSWAEGTALNTCFSVLENTYGNRGWGIQDKTISSLKPPSNDIIPKHLFKLLIENDSENFYDSNSSQWWEWWGIRSQVRFQSLAEAEQSFVEIFEMLYRRNWCWPSITSRSIYAFSCATYARGFMLNPALFWIKLGQKYLNRDCIQWKTTQDLREPSSALVCLAEIMRKVIRSRLRERYLPGWRRILSRVIELYGHNQLGRKSPLFEFVQVETYREWPVAQEKLSQMASIWIHELISAGLTGSRFEQYLEFEKVYLPLRWKKHRIGAFGRLDDPCVRIISLTIEKSSKSCRVWVSWPPDEHAGEFWRMVENTMYSDVQEECKDSKLHIPGAWQEEYNHNCWAQRNHISSVYFRYDRGRGSKRKARRILRHIGFFDLPEEEYKCCKLADHTVKALFDQSTGCIPARLDDF